MSRGAPKRIMVTWRSGARISESRRERRAAYTVTRLASPAFVSEVGSSVGVSAYNNKVWAGPVAGLLLLAGLRLPVLWRAGPGRWEAQEGVENVQEGYYG